MQLSLLKDSVLYTCVLPEKKKGQYWVTQLNAHGDEEQVISVEGMDGRWVLKSNRNAAILDSGQDKIKELVLEPQAIYHIHLRKTDETVVLYTDPITEDRKLFRKFRLPSAGRFKIGRVEGCDIQYGNKYASSLHAELHVTPAGMTIQDCGSSNGTFVNGIKINAKAVAPSDVISIVGLKLIIGNGYIALNNPDGQVRYKQELLVPFVKPAAPLASDDDEPEQQEVRLFYRSPRFKREIDRPELTIDAPPALGNQDPMPLVLLLGPSLTMGMASAFTGLVAVQNVLGSGGSMMKAMPMIVMSSSMLLGTIFWPIMSRKYEDRKRKQREKTRKLKYMNYLEGIRKEIAAESDKQSSILHENHVTLDQCMNRIKTRERNLWERTRRQNDFLKVRLGLGTLPLSIEVKHPPKRFSMDDDSLQDELNQLAVEPKLLHQVPVSFSLIDHWVSGMIGNREEVAAFVKGLIFQLTALHSYDELKLVFIFDRKEYDMWEFVKWLPHVWNEDKSVRFLATTVNEVKELSAFLEREMASRDQLREEELRDVSPYYLIIALDKHLALKAEALSQLLKQKKNIGISLINVYEELMQLPKECSWVIDFQGGTAKIYDKNDTSAHTQSFMPDRCAPGGEMELAVALANIELDSAETAYTLPQTLTFLEMFGVGKIEHLNALTRWKENDPTLSLQTPIGVDPGGEWFFLDLHEKFHGPHGLIAGMTGSGKSEFIMTFILSLAVNYHPHEVAFILIDYKGGGMANAFLDLPHLAGTITNLDGASVKRSLISIQSELKRRQAIFSETSKRLTISNMDIYKYQKLFREGRVDEPLQHLFIISDEFAELKTQQPEFMTQLVSAARIGRSLGVHLILATQKPSGVVDDQIWSNSRFRICLKVQEKADSMDMIKRPDAANLSVTGRYYVQVGFNELFALGQSGWAGAPYEPSDRAERKKEAQIAVVDNLGRVLKQVKADNRRIVRNPPKQIDEINCYLKSIADEEHIKVRPMWLEPIPGLIHLAGLRAKYGQAMKGRYELDPIVGEVDNPASQSQHVMRFPLSREGNAVIYGAAGSGKTTFVTTLMHSLMTEHTPDEVNIYALDFASETLRAFAKAPHVGDVLLAHEAEKVANLFKMLQKELVVRKKRFADYGGDYHSYVQSSPQGAAAIVVIIHNFSAFAETFGELEDTMAFLSREGLKYGVYFVLTALNTGAVRYRILQNFKQLYVLQLNDPSDYSSVLGNVEGLFPSKFKGRGIFKTDSVYEFQTAHVHEQPERVFEAVRTFSSDCAAQWSGSPAPRIPILPDRVDTEYLMNELKRSEAALPVGIEKASLQISSCDFEQSYVHVVMSQAAEKSSFLQGLSEAFAARNRASVLVLDPDNRFNKDEDAAYRRVVRPDDLEASVVELFSTLVTRNNAYKDAIAGGQPAPEFEKQVCIVQSLTSLLSSLSDDGRDKLKVLLEKGEAAYQVVFILADTVSGFSSVSFEAWFKSKVSTNDGIWVGNGIADQYQLRLAKTSSELYQELAPGFGYVVRKGQPVLTKLLVSVTDQTEVGEDG
ncbi:type VII secretion protein EssC [Paenibacillus athensensis]|uniref:Type VII secretion protein EssC n=1 Tax=Paenibacillus athensensis TaxID=1967502 RepID=A0A4Y8Q723_9BACL|nr:type VII secretion protein EssC [Paenibacillus athensensis]MCD1257391.1 type VII secretion protein EssC [Paenibacillus athensensis]